MKATKTQKVKKSPEEKIYKTLPYEVKVVDEVKRTLVVAISTPNADRSGDTMSMKGMNYKNYLNNPVVMEYHDYKKDPIATCESLVIKNDAIIATVKFPDEGKYPRSDQMYNMYKDNLLNAWSIGFMPLEYDYNETGGFDFKAWELFEFSAVAVPDNPNALTILRSKGINVDLFLKQAEGNEEEATEEEDIEEEDIEEDTAKPDVIKGAIGYKKTPLAAKDEAWDGSAEVKKATVDDLKVMCAWVDSENKDTKGAYKLPHHKADGEHAVVWNGVKAAGDAVQGARNKLDVPDGDLAGIKSHLEKHYHEFEEKAPWEDEGKAVDEEVVETKDLPAGDEDNPKDPGYTEDTKVTELTVAQLIDIIDRTLDQEEDEDENEPDEKTASEAVTKDVGEVIQLAYILDALSWFISCFEMNEVSQPSIDKLTQALDLVMQVVAEQAVLGQKSFKLSDFSETKESVKLLAKAGRTISSKHEGMLKDSCDYMSKAMGNVQTVLDTVAAQEDEEKNIEPEEAKEREVAPEVPEKEDLMKKIANSIKNNNQQQAALIRQAKETKSLTEKLLEEIKLRGGEK